MGRFRFALRLGGKVSVPEALCMAAWARRARGVVVFYVIFRSPILLGGGFGGWAGGVVLSGEGMVLQKLAGDFRR